MVRADDLAHIQREFRDAEEVPLGLPLHVLEGVRRIARQRPVRGVVEEPAGERERMKSSQAGKSARGTKSICRGRNSSTRSEMLCFSPEMETESWRWASRSGAPDFETRDRRRAESRCRRLGYTCALG